MTKGELLESMKDIPDDAEIDIYDLKDYYHPSFRINTQTYFNYDSGLPIITIETNCDSN